MTENRLKCAFCGKSQDQVRKLIAGPGCSICDARPALFKATSCRQ